MNRLQIREEVENRMQDADNALATDVQINGWANQAIRTIGTGWNWPFMKKRASVSIAINADTANLPADFRTALRVAIAAGELFPVTERYMLDKYGIAPAIGTPEVYTDGGFSQTQPAQPTRILRVAPKASVATAVTISYLIQVPTLSADTDFPPFPTDFDEAVILWVMDKYYRQVDDESNALASIQAFTNEIGRLVASYGALGQDRFPAIPAGEARTSGRAS